MEPAIQTGSVVIVSPIVPDTIRKGDIIMYSSLDMTSLTTHRVVNVESEPKLQFITKGDANNNSDVIPVTPGQIVGIVAFTIPYLGLLAQFIKTPLGFTLFLLIPAVILIGCEMLDLWREME
jgi:signal peptidase